MKNDERGKWGVLYMTSAAMLIMTIDMTMMNVSISALVSDLNTTVLGIQLAVSLYTLIMAAFMIIGAKLADIVGTKKVFVVGLSIYGAGTTLATIAPNLAILLIGWSVLEGVGAALMMPVTITYITKEYVGKDRAFAFGVWSAVGGAAAAFGPIIGGFFTTYLTWRLGFGMEVLIVAGMFAKMKVLGDYPPIKKIKIDVIGSILVASGLFMITLSILMIDPLGDAPVMSIFAMGVVSLVIFAFYERKRMIAGKDTLVDLHIFKSRTFIFGNLVSLFFQITLAGIMFSLPIFLQNVRGYNAMDTGIAVLPTSVMMFIFSIYGEKFRKYMSPKRIVQLGIGFAFVGIALLMIVFSPNTTSLQLAPGLAFYGTGLGLIFSQITDITMSGAPKKLEAEASGLFNSQKQLGMSLGTSFIGAALILGMIDNITAKIYQSGYFPDASKSEIRAKVIDWLMKMKSGIIGIPPQYMDAVQRIANSALANAMNTAMLFLMISLIIGGVFSVFLPNDEK